MEVLRSVYAAFARGDVASTLEALDPSVEWHAQAGGPLGETYQGRTAVERWLRSLEESFTEISLDPEEFSEVDDYVVVRVRVRARGSHSGAAVDLHRIHVDELRKGRVVWRRVFATEDEAWASVRARSAASRAVELQD